MKYTAKNPLVLSYSSLQAYKNCKKSFDLGYARRIKTETNAAVERGKDFHTLMEEAGRTRIEGTPAPRWYFDPTEEMEHIAAAYLKHNHLPDGLFAVEQPLYTRLLPNVYLRTTFDWLAKDNGWVEIGDYKTFSRNVTPDNDLDYQARLYLYVVGEHFKTLDVRFKHAHVRSALPLVPKDKAGNCWTLTECYPDYSPIIASSRELLRIYAETIEIVKDILRKLKEEDEEKRSILFWREDSKKPFACDGCFHRELCKAELLQGRLTEATIDALSIGVREASVLPVGARGKASYLCAYAEAKEIETKEKA